MLYRFEDCVLDTGRRELHRAAIRIDMEPQVFDLLEFLVRRRDRVASRDDLLDAVWNGRIVSESTLSSRINAARTAIGDDGAAQRLIRTLPRKGIRFVGAVREEDEADAPPAEAKPNGEAAHGGIARDGPAIAVLPFTNMSADAGSEYFADGMAEEIITGLARCSGLIVIARNSSFTFKGRAVDVREIGRELGVGYVLEGSVRRDAERLRITAQLIDAATGAHLWADRFDGPMTEVFTLQDQITANAVAVIEPRLRFAEVARARRTPPQYLDAYDLWLRAVSLASEFTPESMAAALRLLEQALRIDPTYALAMSTAAYYHAQRHFQGWLDEPEDGKSKGVQLAWDALQQSSDDSNVLWMAAFALWTLAKDGPKARELFRRSLALNDNHAIALSMAGWFESANGNPAEGRRLLERSQRLNPCHPRGWVISAGLSIASLAEAKYGEAIDWAQKAVLQNRRFAVALRVLAVALAKRGELARAREVVAELLRLEPRLTVSGLGERLPSLAPALFAAYAEGLRAAGLPA